MAKITVTIIGLGRVGASIGLALKRYNQKPNPQHQFEITGVEDRPSVLKDAEKLGAFDKSIRNIYDAARERDIVVLALPYADVQRAYQTMGDGLRAGCVVIDTSPLKLPSQKWAEKFLSKEAHMVGVVPIVNPQYLFDGLDDTNHASADYFDKGTMLVMPSPSCIREAVELATDFSGLLGSAIQFMDPGEYDGLTAATEGLPAVLGVMTFHMLSHAPGWGDTQRLTNPSFGRLTHHLFDTHPDDLRDAWLNNRDSLLNYTDALLESLHSFRQVLASGDRDAVEALLGKTSDDYSTWVNRRYNNKWGEDDKSAKGPSTGEMLMTGLMGGFLSRRLRGSPNGDDKH
jgi:prephenate dehydrogenase